MLLPYQEVLIWGLIISFVLSVVYRIFTNPKEMKQIKKDMKFYKEKSKEAQKKKDIKKVNEYNSDMMKLSQKQMSKTMKPMFISMAVVLLLLGYINNTYNGVLVELDQDDATMYGTFAYMGFSHDLKAEKVDDVVTVTVDTNDNNDFSDEESYVNGDIASIEDSYWIVIPGEAADENGVMKANVKMDLAVKLPFVMPFVGWTSLNWLFWYVLCTLPATFVFRRFLGVE
ncbi:MAG: DUF106 domain-containing protein [Candidatus Aenigmarchaeota archaeon]|nr:DUF106 domain-containing protein [Candidatus Aenigmarchaeota archaeon]